MKILLNLFLLILAFQISFGQEKPKAALVDDFTVYNCCDLTQRVDGFAHEIYKSEHEIGYVIVHGKKNALFNSFYYESVLLSWLSFIESRHDEKKVFLIRGEEEDRVRFEFWKTLKNSNLDFSNKVWDFRLPKLKTKLNFSIYYYGELCGQLGKEKHFAEILSNNSNIFGHLFINAKSQSSFIKQKEMALDELVTYNAPKEQIKTFYIRVKKDEGIEYWLVPKKKRN